METQGSGHQEVIDLWRGLKGLTTSDMFLEDGGTLIECRLETRRVTSLSSSLRLVLR